MNQVANHPWILKDHLFTWKALLDTDYEKQEA